MRDVLFLFGFVFLAFAGCNGYQPAREIDDAETTMTITDSFMPADAPAGSDSLIIGTASTDEILVQQMESFPVQVRVLVKGNLPDGCTTLDTPKIQREENVFLVLLHTRRPKDAMCTQALVPYEKIIPLDVAGLEAGEFTVNVNGEVRTFKLLTKNELDRKE